ncbi:MAG: thiolase family protein [Pseudomonadota bacterium]
MKRAAAVMGVGITDWAEDYKRTRAGERPNDSYGYAAQAFTRALADCGIDRSQIDGLIVGPTTSYERTGEILGMDVGWGGQADAGMAVIQACMAIKCGLARTIALVYGNDQRSAAVQYGGSSTSNPLGIFAYVYHTPWGMTSQGALYALMFRRYCEIHGLPLDCLGPIAVAQRANASRNPDAVMKKEITLDDYAKAAFVCEPLRLLDYCLVNDGGVCMIISEASIAEKGPKQPVYIEGIGRGDLNRGATSLEPRLFDFYLPAQRAAARQVYDMAGLGPDDMDCLQIYDSFSCHIPFALEGFGFCGEGEAAGLVKRKSLRFDGELPVNTGGGNLSESYMQGWNHQVEAVRQLRGEGGARQVKDCNHAQYICDMGGKVVSVIYGK